EQIRQAFPLVIKGKISIAAMEASKPVSTKEESPFGEFLAGIGLGAAIGAAEFKSLIAGEEVTYRAPMSIRDFLDSLKVKLKGSVQNLSVTASGTIITIASGKEELCTMQIQSEGDETTVFTEGLKVQRAWEQGKDTLKETLEFTAGAVFAVDALKNDGLGALGSLLNTATETMRDGEEAIQAAGRLMGTVTLSKRIAGVINGVATNKVRAFERAKAADRQEIFTLKEEIENGTQCSSCGTPRSEESNCHNCGSPYEGVMLVQQQVEAKKEQIKQLSA
ncbi:MAG TPA: hypothetical protein VJ246_01265, partial [Patescibacteria group bacterium]|nr:hypothetical protein [Patescibacteria group bacterium]